MPTPSSDLTPEKILRMAFWSGEPPAYEAWRKIIRRPDMAHDASLLRQTFKHLPMPWLYEQLGEDALIKRWPEIREALDDPSDAIAIQKREAWDALWASHALGDAQYPVSSKVSSLSRLRRDLLRRIIANPGCSIYELARDTRRDYSRVHKDVALLETENMVAIQEGTSKSGRAVRVLVPCNTVNAALWASVRARLPS